jgi:hypothetical protein
VLTGNSLTANAWGEPGLPASTSLLAYDVYERNGSAVEVKIGVTDSPRELIFKSSQTPDELEKLVTDALTKGSEVVSLSDEKGRRFLVLSSRIAYLEIGVADSRRVGFGVGSGPVTAPTTAE